MTIHELKEEEQIDKRVLNKRIETVAWGLFLIMFGGQMFFPEGRLPDGIWSIGIGLIFLGLNGARYMNGIRMSGFTTALGVIALLSGFAALLGFAVNQAAVLLILLGAYIMIKPWIEERQLFGKVEQS